jgi:hypothetical protein
MVLRVLTLVEMECGFTGPNPRAKGLEKMAVVPAAAPRPGCRGTGTDLPMALAGENLPTMGKEGWAEEGAGR